MQIKKRIIRNLQNIPGWKTPEKLVVIESDDWGSIRMPSREIYDHLLKKRFSVDRDPFMKYDSLEGDNDLTVLMEILASVKDKNGNNAIMTINTLMANPDFEEIERSGFNEYYYESFTETYKKYPGRKNSFSLLQEGIRKRLFRPQCHGREHLNVDKWMAALQQNDKNIIEAFEHGMISISSEPTGMTFGYMEALDYYSEQEKLNKIPVVNNALELFRSTFGYPSGSFMACCFVWDNDVESILKNHGTYYLQGIVQQLRPNISKDRHKFDHIYHYTGETNKTGQVYLVRNCFFEPSLSAHIDSVDTCLRDINTAFFYRKPAIISSHRLNFIGSIDSENRDRNLADFARLLKEIIRRWPDVVFLSSDELGGKIKKVTVN